MNSTAIRVYVVSGIIVLAFGVSYLLQAATEAPEVEKPNWSLRDLPMQFDKFRGEDTELDPQLAVATGGDVIVNRIYRDDQGHGISVHTVSFLDPAEGVLHNPLNCYVGNGWRKIDETKEKVQAADDLSIVVCSTTWEKEGEKIVVIYWYQLGQHLLYERWDLGKIRWSMKGQPTWPILVKVMIQLPMTDPDETKTLGLGFAQKFAAWLNNPEHRKYLDRWGGV